jgi:hypothetical protein
MKRLFVIALICSVAGLAGTGCTDATVAKFKGLGNPHLVEMYSGGKRVRHWVSSGKVQSEENSDGYYFNDTASGKLIEVSGDVVITMLKNKAEAAKFLKQGEK